MARKPLTDIHALFIGDTHAFHPYNLRIWKTTQLLINAKPEHLFLNGDILELQRPYEKLIERGHSKKHIRKKFSDFYNALAEAMPSDKRYKKKIFNTVIDLNRHFTAAIINAADHGCNTNAHDGNHDEALSLLAEENAIIEGIKFKTQSQFITPTGQTAWIHHGDHFDPYFDDNPYQSKDIKKGNSIKEYLLKGDFYTYWENPRTKLPYIRSGVANTLLETFGKTTLQDRIATALKQSTHGLTIFSHTHVPLNTNAVKNTGDNFEHNSALALKPDNTWHLLKGKDMLGTQTSPKSIDALLKTKAPEALTNEKMQKRVDSVLQTLWRKNIEFFETVDTLTAEQYQKLRTKSMRTAAQLSHDLS